MEGCPEELQTQHYRGRWFGFGPVRDNERVIFAIFEQTPRTAASLNDNSFENNKLKKDEQSLARGRFVTWPLFQLKIAQRDRTAKGALVGIVWAEAAKLRELRADVKFNAETKKVRAICIPDRVGRDDCSGHATMGYEGTGALNLSPTQLGTIRKKIRYDLADTFSNVIQPDSIRWAGIWDIFIGRVRSIIRVFFQSYRF